jgi:bifunctional non-homologous end joining protein LigD
VVKFSVMGLAEYKRKRDFKKTAEPAGKPLPKKLKGASRFVIQKHAARRLHYDLRLEMDGVLKSWALPKGLPWKRGEKHLAVEVEDHPIEYEGFEGVIPEGQYGGGTVMVWDRGTYYVYGEQPIKSLQEGKLHLLLDGKKARGEWTLVRIRGRDGEKNQWLILKTGADAKPISKKFEDQSVKTSRTMKQIAEARDAEWQSDRVADESPTSQFKARIREAIKKKEVGRDRRARRGINLGDVRGKRSDRHAIATLPDLPSAKPRFIEPMNAKLVEKPLAAGDWMYELKFDGIRLIAVKAGQKVSLLSRNQNDLTRRFPEIAEVVKNLPANECVVDGEVVALDEEGRSSFQLLQAREMEGRNAPVYFYAFDLLQFDGKSLIRLPLEARKNVLEKLCDAVAGGVDPGSVLRYSGAIGNDPTRLLKEVKRRGLEGIIGKQRNSVYEPGRRSGAWIKLKCVNEQEFVIGGYTPPQGARKHFGAILVGYYKNPAAAELVFAGKVGTGFSSKSLAVLHKKFQDQQCNDCPFADLPSKQNGQWVQGITPSMMKKMHWIKPRFVAEIKFAEWTRDKKLRAPVFLGLREDKDPRDVIRES